MASVVTTAASAQEVVRRYLASHYPALAGSQLSVLKLEMGWLVEAVPVKPLASSCAALLAPTLSSSATPTAAALPVGPTAPGAERAGPGARVLMLVNRHGFVDELRRSPPRRGAQWLSAPAPPQPH